ncbi:hypothetical protein H4R21_003533 [Coemansia helicoidea]|uniref:Uncharacterized protein n=1 Tax=Coemansia helicoidea TaxID=1286919 RepID=A0ACC1L1B7_9FUNG|nr:hypothetical protein H4R21_003533 [Coemansia helicoidea]
MAQPALLLAVTTAVAAALAPRALAQQTAQQTAQPYTITAATTYRPERSATAGYSPMPLTPDLGRIADSVASEPSAAAAMRQARAAWDAASTRDEL